MNGLGQHQHTHHSGSWSLRLVPPFTWTGGVSPGSPASLCPCPSTVVAVRGVTPALGYYDGSVAIQDTGVLQAIPQLHGSERRRGAPFASCLPYREWAATVGAGHRRSPLCRHRPCRG